MGEHTKPSDATRQEEARDASMTAEPDRMPTESEEQAAEANEPVDPDVARSMQEAAETGARNKGEGRIP